MTTEPKRLSEIRERRERVQEEWKHGGARSLVNWEQLEWLLSEHDRLTERVGELEGALEQIVASIKSDLERTVANSHVELDEWCGSVDEMLSQFEDNQIVAEIPVTKGEYLRAAQSAEEGEG